MKKEFLNFTGKSWGEYSNASGQSRIPNVVSEDEQSLYDYIYQQLVDMDLSEEEIIEYLSPYYGGGNWTTPTSSPTSWVGTTDCDNPTFCVAPDIESWAQEFFQETELDGSLPSIALFGKAIIQLYGCEGLVDVTNPTATPMDFYLVALTSAGHIAGTFFIATNPQQGFLNEVDGSNLMLNFSSGNFNYLAGNVQDYLIEVQNYIINNCVSVSESGSQVTPQMAAEAYHLEYGCMQPNPNTAYNFIIEFLIQYFGGEVIDIMNSYGGGNDYAFLEDMTDALEVLCQTPLGGEPVDEPISDYYEQSSPCEQYTQAFEYLQANPQITIENAEYFGESIFILLGRNQNTNEGQYGDAPVAVEEDTIPVDPDAELAYAEIYYEPQNNCNSFMHMSCQGQDFAYPEGETPDESIIYYNQEEVANTLASAILSLNDFVLDIANGEISLTELGAPEGANPVEIFEVVEEILERVVELEMECNNLQLVPVVVEQAVGQMVEDYLTWAYNNGYFDDYSDLSAEVGNQLTLQDVVCMDEYFHNDSFYFIFELLNYTPSICGGVDGCPECPECPPVVGGGLVSQGGLCSDGRPPKFDGKKYICSDGRPPKPSSVKPVKKIKQSVPKSRAPRTKSRFNGRNR